MRRPMWQLLIQQWRTFCTSAVHAEANRSGAILIGGAQGLESRDARQPNPYVHWIVYDIPPATTSLHESIPAMLRLSDPKGALHGRNSRGSVGYVGSQPPKGDPAHHYHFEVFALDIVGPGEPGIDRETLLRTMQGHVLGRGEVIGTFQRARR